MRKYRINHLGSKEFVQGSVVISSPAPFKHNGISITVEGSVQLHLSGKSIGVFEAFYNSTKVTSILLPIESGKFSL